MGVPSLMQPLDMLCPLVCIHEGALTADLADTIQALLPDAGSENAHPFNMLQGVYHLMPSVDAGHRGC